MANLIMFCVLAVIILGSAIVCVTTHRIMRAATFLLFVLFGVAGIYFLLDYTFLGAAQISIYAGGITMVYIFAVQLVSKRVLQGIHARVNRKTMYKGIALGIASLLVVLFITVKNTLIDQSLTIADEEIPMNVIGEALLGSGKYQYVLPFEFISVFLLACIIGGLMIARKEDEQ